MARSTRGTTPMDAWPRAGLRTGREGGAIASGRVAGCLRCVVEGSGSEGGLRARSTWVDVDSGRAIEAPVVLSHEPLVDLRRLVESTRVGPTTAEEARTVEDLDPGPVAQASRLCREPAAFCTGGTPVPQSESASSGGWLGWISYDYGRMLEPRARSAQRDGGSRSAMRGETDANSGVAWPLMEVMRVEGLAHRSASEVLDARRERGEALANWRLDGLCSAMGREGYERAVQRAIEYIRAGDVYQVNLAHEFRGEFRGRPRDLLRDLWASADPRFGGWFFSPPDEDGGTRAIISASPELFLAYRARDRAIVTRPMKGTRRAGSDSRNPAGERTQRGGAGVPPVRVHERVKPRRDAWGTKHPAADLEASIKDRAELAMIIDLMRNDLGRVAAIGSVRVSDPRRIEAHGTGDATLLQAIGEVRATLRDGRDVVDLLQASFPPGSVTGAPKVRAMQIIDELEVSRRGAYCGTMFLIDDAGDAWFNVMIRTARLEMPSAGAAARGVPGVLRYSVGAGIVADSDPASEWRETVDKAGVLRAALEDGLRLGG